MPSLYKLSIYCTFTIFSKYGVCSGNTSFVGKLIHRFFFPSVSRYILQVCTKGFDDVQVNDELERLAQAFSVGSHPWPLTALVIQVSVRRRSAYYSIIIFVSFCCMSL